MPIFDIPELTEIVRNLEEILTNQKALAEHLQSMKTERLPFWIGLKEACALKGVAYSTIQKPENKHLMPPLAEQQRVGKGLKWPRDVILKWLMQKDRELEEVKSRLSNAQTIMATPKPMNEMVLKEPAPVYDQLDEVNRLISEIEEQSNKI